MRSLSLAIDGPNGCPWRRSSASMLVTMSSRASVSVMCSNPVGAAMLPHPRSCREQLPPVMAGDGEIEDRARRGGACEPNRRELLGMATPARHREHPAGRTDLRREMAIESGLVFLTQAGCALLHRCARDLRHARGGRAGPRREWKDVEMRQRAGIDEIERAGEHLLGFGRKAGNHVGAEHEIGRRLRSCAQKAIASARLWRRFMR